MSRVGFIWRLNFVDCWHYVITECNDEIRALASSIVIETSHSVRQVVADFVILNAEYKKESWQKILASKS